MPYLLAAEADQIQDLLHRSSRLRQVVGGSQLLSRFCDEMSKILLSGNKNAETIISGGGSLRVRFENSDDAVQFGERLAEVYHLALDGSITVAAPAAYAPDFPSARDQAEVNLRIAKRDHRTRGALASMPFIAICASCGIGIATQHDKRFDDDTRAFYLCASCRVKAAEQDAKSRLKFVGEFIADVADAIEALSKLCPTDQSLQNLSEKARKVQEGQSEDRVEHALDEFRFPLEADDVEYYDPRNYVAYLLADANGMGEVFGKFASEKDVKRLSKGLQTVMRESLAVPSAQMMRHKPKRPDPRKSIKPLVPTLPLILGGDDLFALIPAPWALHVALTFCQEFQQRISNVLPAGATAPTAPTISAVVVICKSNYPFAQAYDVGHARLEQAKSLSKAHALVHKKGIATVGFELIQGSTIQAHETKTQDYRPTLRPYWSDGTAPSDWGLPLEKLLDARYELRNLPGKRLAELRALFDLPLFPMSATDKDVWQARYRQLIARIGRMVSPHAQALKALNALNELGGDRLIGVNREVDSNIWHGHALPDLLDIWDYSYRLDRPQSDYEEDAR